MSGIHPVTIPKWGIEMQEGTVTAWRFNEGDAVEKGVELIDIESDKIVNTMEAPVSGVLHRILADVDETLKVGQLLGVIAPSGTAPDEIDAFIAAFAPADAGFGIDDGSESSVASSTDEATVEQTETTTAVPPAPPATVRVSPVAKRLARKLGVDLSRVRGTGRGGRISTSDVEAAATASEATAGEPDAVSREASSAEITARPLSSRELAAARRLVAAKQAVPHFYLQRDLDLRAALATRERTGVPVTVLLLKALAGALRARPRVNAHLVDEKRMAQAGIAVNVAVDTPDGLVAPLLPDVDAGDLDGLADRLKALAQKARDKALEKADLAPGGITLSNLGMFGITEFTAIITPPQVAILAVGTLRPLDLGDGPVPALTATLSCDHRAIDGAEGARFLAALQEALDTL